MIHRMSHTLSTCPPINCILFPCRTLPHKETVTTSDHFAASEEAGFSGTFMAAAYHSNWSYDMEMQRFFPQTYPVDKDPNPFKHPQIFVAAKATGLNYFQRIKDVVTFPSLRVEYFKMD